MFRVGETLVLRLPRRGEGVRTTNAEHVILPLLPELLSRHPHRLGTPTLLHQGRPTSYFGRPWSLLAWLPGESLFESQVNETSTLLEQLTSFLTELHRPAPEDAPANPHRGGPLATRTAAMAEHLRSLEDSVEHLEVGKSQIEATWHGLRATESWNGPGVWLHGDLHPGNMLAVNGQLSGIIDWGDACSGDPATDLAVAWMLFDEGGRTAFKRSLEQAGHPVDEAMWQRSRAWALSLALAHAAALNEPRHQKFGHMVIKNVVG